VLGLALLPVVLLGDFVHAVNWPMGTLAHTWSLAVEEQFYLLWPGALAALYTRRSRPLVLLGWVIFGLLVWRAGLLVVGAESWVYFGPDTNAYSLLLGAVAAFWARDGVRVPGRVGAAAMMVLVLLAGLPLSTTVGLWLQPLAALAGVGLVLSAAAVRGLAWWPLRGVGRVSYGLYLWHMLFIELADQYHFGVPGRWVACAVALTVSIVSFELVERRVALTGSGTVNRPGVDAGSDSPKDDDHASAEEVPAGAAGASEQAPRGGA
jgi:peptidoglycan/LPS O-acetylase OafA/YrhL